MEIITSKDNKKIKKLLALRKAGKRKREKQIIIEGEKEIVMARQGGVDIIELYYCPDFGRPNKFALPGVELVKNVFEKISLRENPDGFLALASRPVLELSDIRLSGKPLVLVLEGLEKPGNIGAIIRTAAAAGVDAVLLSDAQADAYSPNVIRSSRGAVFGSPIAVGSNEQVLAWLQERGLKIFAALIDEKSQAYTKADFNKGTALVIGTEHDGLSDFWIKVADEFVQIPMKAGIDSLNASVSAALLLYEAIRQRS